MGAPDDPREDLTGENYTCAVEIFDNDDPTVKSHWRRKRDFSSYILSWDILFLNNEMSHRVLSLFLQNNH